MHRINLPTLLGLFGILLAYGRPEPIDLSETGQTAPDDTLRLNHIQVIGSHNSYKERIDPSLLNLIWSWDSNLGRSLDYAHPTLTEQLDLGLRKLELDVFYDPEGGRYARPVGVEWVRKEGLPPGPPHDSAGVLLAPGFKVMHVQDIDYRSSCLTLEACLDEVRSWSDRHPGHLPLFITVNAKDADISDHAFVHPLPFTAEALDALDEAILAALGNDRLLRPDDVRGDRASLEEAVLADGWPRLDDTRGKVLFVLDETGDKQAAYIDGHPALQGRVMFVNAPEGTPEAAVRIVNDPIADGVYIRELVEAGYLVRTRADANTTEARRNTTKRRDAAFASGAHIVSTDYYRPGMAYGKDFETDYQVPVDGAAACNPVTAPPACRAEVLE